MPPTEEDIAWFRSTFHPIPKPALPDDCVEYSLHLISSALERSDDSELRLRLRDVQKYASELQRQWVKDYIWQRQGFNLELIKENGVSLLQGRTEYGDSVEDEWVLTWLLRELTKRFKDLWIKVSDSDGEFLLIEASGTLPAWLEPDVAQNRVWIHNGGLVIIKPENVAKSSKRTKEKLSLQDARHAILHEPKRLMRSPSVEEEAFFRLRNYPGQIKENMHHALVTVPRKIAFLLRQKPAYIAPAVEAFYLRDPIALKPLQTNARAETLIFVPSDLATVSIKFPRVAYAQLKSQDFPAPALWQGKMPAKSDEKYAAADTGMKITCGFEMLLSDPHNQDKAAVREMKMLLDDVESGDETLPTDQDIASWDQLQDDEKWLGISFDDLEGELAGRSKGTRGTLKREDGKFGDAAAQENLQRIVRQFEDFLNDDRAGIDGAGLFEENSDSDDRDEEDSDLDIDSDFGEDKEASFDEDEFTKMMREMMGMPAEVMREAMSTVQQNEPAAQHDPKAGSSKPPGHVEELDSSSSEGDEEMQEMMKQMEAELRKSGALDLDAKPDMSSRRIGSTKSAWKGKQTVQTAKEQGDKDDTSDDPGSENEIDVNLARNLLESLKSQAGTAGPGGNLLGMLGMKMPRDEDDADQEGRSHEKRK